MNYQEMSDFEINIEVAKHIDNVEINDDGMPEKGVSIPSDEYANASEFKLMVFDPCNSWADAGPIIQANKIPLNPFRGDWVAGERRNVKDKNPLRAAMIVFLMMKGGE